MKARFIYYLIPFLVIFSVQASIPTDLHTPWSAQLMKYVSKGKVAYTSWNKESLPDLEAYLKSLESLPKDSLENAKDSEKMAFYINAYNAYTVKAILSHPGIKSIKDIKPNAWKQKIVFLSGDILSLDDLEHKILRKKFKEPRIHFAIVCASVSCPPLQNTAFTTKNLEQMLSKATQDYLADKAQNQFKGKKTRLSKIFDWFKKDFEAYPGGLKMFLRHYAPGFEPDKPIEYMEYNWSLNGK